MFDFPKNVEVIIGKLEHSLYAGIYEKEQGMFLENFFIFYSISRIFYEFEFFRTSERATGLRSNKHCQLRNRCGNLL